MKKCKSCGAPLEGFLYNTIGKLMGVKPSANDPETCNKCAEKPVSESTVTTEPSMPQQPMSEETTPEAEVPAAEVSAEETPAEETPESEEDKPEQNI